MKFISRLNVWKRGKKAARHKPLMLLYMLGQMHQGKGHRQSFDEVCKNIKPYKKYVEDPGAEYSGDSWLWYPFWHLHDKNLWQLETRHPAEPLHKQLPCECERIGGTPRPNLKWAKNVKNNLYGGFTEELANRLKYDNEFAMEFSSFLLGCFDSSLHEDLIKDLGISR